MDFTFRTSSVSSTKWLRGFVASVFLAAIYIYIPRGIYCFEGRFGDVMGDCPLSLVCRRGGNRSATSTSQVKRGDRSSLSRCVWS